MLQTIYQKGSAQVPKARSGDAASNEKQWCHFNQMSSFLQNKTFHQTTGNLDEEEYDDSD